MIAAGSLFTSCVTNTEPQGIKDIRQAKADYIESLSNLKKAEAEKVKAEAAYQDALTAYQNAQTALVEADVKAKEIRNSVLDAKAQAEIEATLAAAQIAAVEAAEKLAIAEFELQQTLNNLAVWSQELTPAERLAIEVYTKAYDNFIAAEQAVRKAESKVYYSELKYEEAILKLRVDTAIQSGIIEANVMALNNLPDSGASEADIKALFNLYNQAASEAKYDLANIDAEWNLYRQTEVAENIKGFATELSEWVVKNAALPAPYAVHYRAELPDNDQVNELFAYYFNEYYSSNANVEVSLEDKAIAANFYSIPSAEEGLKQLNTVISALSRELVVDSTSYAGRIDTAGLAKAVAAANKDYNDTEAALKAGVEAYKPVVDAKAALKTAEQTKKEKDSLVTVAENAYKADKDSLKAAIENFVAVWNKIDIIDENDTTELLDALHKLSVAREVLPYDGPRKYFYFKKGSDNVGNPIIDSVKFTELTKAHIAKDATAKAKDEGHTLFSSAIEQFFGCDYFNAKFITGTPELKDISLNELHEKTNYFGTLFFAQYLSDPAVREILKNGNISYEPAAVANAKTAAETAETAVTTAKTAVADAYKGYYENVYCHFWGLNIDAVYDAENRKLKEDVDSLVINFTKETFTKETVCAKFKYTGENPWFKDSAFVKPLSFRVKNNDEIKIVWEQLGMRRCDFAKTLLANLLCKEQLAANYSIGSEGTTKALARLQEIEGELFAEVIVAIAKQVENSQPFFAFVENLFGKECIDGFFARIDSAATAAAEFVPATTDSQENIAKLIAEGKLTSKQIFTLGFEYFMCGSFGEDSAYRTAYEHMQIAKAFAGEEFADLVSDVIAAYIQAKDIKLDVEGYDNILEKILFGTVEKVTLSESVTPVEVALKIVAPVVGPFLTSNFGGKIAELQEKYFTEWATEWATYDVKHAAINAKLEQIETEAKVVAEYAKDVKYLIRRADHYRANIAAAVAQYTKDCETLAAIEAGADWRSLLNEKIQDELAKAIVKLEAAKVELETAYEAYKQVLANHNLAQ